jgi:long-chain fatty acid transport protein
MGVYYQTRQNFKFEDSILLRTPGGPFLPPQDVSLGLPRNIGFGVANNALMDGNLLLAADVLWKNWEDTDLMGAIYHDQWVVQLGSQYTQGRCKYRAGYVWAENPVKQLGGGSLGGVVPPGGLSAAQFVQAQLAVVSQHRLSAGIGISNVLPNVDLDLNVGGMLHDTERLGTTNVGISSYWVAFGLTWHFGPCGGACGESCSGGF